MCGIFGTIANNYKHNGETAKKVCELLSHRGPDDQGVIRFPQGMLLNARLSIIDLSKGGHQPMRSQDGKIFMVFNGEIYNYRDLKEELKGGYKFRTATDTEVIIAAYHKWGENCLNKLRGMFAFALWDERKQILFCATDRFSIKQLYYYHDENTFIFSSEIKPLAVSGVKFLPNEQAIYDFFTFGLQDHDENTFFKNIFQLRPGHYLIFKDGKLKIKQYWDIETDRIEVKKENEKDILEQVENKLKEVMKYHLIADVETALSLSSGLDSNLMRAMVVSLMPNSKTVKCFNFSFKDTVYDEGRYVLSLKDKRTEFFITPVKSDDFFRQYSKLINIMEEPLSGLGTYGYWLNCQTVHNKGIKVLLDGQGGDEMFGGYKYYQEKEFATMKASDGTNIECDYLSDGFAKKFENRKIKPAKKFKSPFRNAVYNDLMFFKIPKLLRFQDKAAMAWSVESRVPYLDHTLCDLMFSVPPEILLKKGIKKYILRNIAKNYLDKTLINKPKLYVSTPQREWVRKDLRKEIIEMMNNSSVEKEGYVDAEKLRKEYDNYLGQKELGNSFFVWKFFSLELWYRNFIKL